jgi:hypothetical protein
MADDHDDIYAGIELMASIRGDIATMAVAIKEKLNPEEQREALALRDMIMKILAGRNMIHGALALADTMYGVIEILEKESILGFVQANSSESTFTEPE